MLHISKLLDGSQFARLFLQYRMIRCIREEMMINETKQQGAIAEDDFVFSFLLSDGPSLTREELRELERKNYIRYEGNCFGPTHRGYYYEW